MQCRAKSKRSQVQCRKAAVVGREVCSMHGGKSLVGPAVNTYRSGRHSRYLPVRMAAKYQEAEHDPELLSLRDQIALVDARLADLLARVDTGESGSLWLS